jgi:AcrR family transcriptional regulator
MPPKPASSSRSTADAIADAARAIFETDGAAGISMRRVADAVGITPMAIYRHYPNREALLDCVANRGFQEMLDYWKPGHADLSPDERLFELLDGYLDYAFAHPRIFDYVFSDARPGARRFPEDFRAGLSPTANLLVEVLQEGMASSVFRKDDVWDVALALWAHSHGLICLYRGGRFSLTQAQFRALHRNSLGKLLHGIRN